MSSILIIGCGSIGERHLRCFQRTGRCEVSRRHLAAYLEASAARYSNRTAVVDANGRQLTYAELNSRSDAHRPATAAGEPVGVEAKTSGRP